MRRAFLYHDVDDTELAKEFRDFFTPIMRRKKAEITICDDRLPGENEEIWVASKVENAEIILLLVTNNLLKRNFFYDKFTPLVVSRLKGCLIVPVIFSASLLRETVFRKLEPTPPKGVPIDQFNPRTYGLLAVSEQFTALLEKYESNIASQNTEVEELKTAISKFNYHSQLPPGVPAPLAPPAASNPFSVLIIKGGQRSGHDLLAWRWRNAALPASAQPQIYTLDLSITTETAGQLEAQAWQILTETTYSGDPGKLTSELTNLLLQRLEQEPIVIRFDHFLPLLQKDMVDQFFKQLSNTLAEAKAKKPSQAPMHPLWFYLFCKQEESDGMVELDFQSQLTLPYIEPVAENDFQLWEEKILSKESVLADCIDFERENILDPDEKKNEVMDVLDRICQAVYAKEDLYDQYIATLK